MSKRIRTKPTRFLLANILALLVSLLMTRTLLMPMFEEQQHTIYHNRLTTIAENIARFIQARKAEVRILANSQTIQSMDWEVAKPFLMSQLATKHTNFEKFVVGLPSSHFYNTVGGNPHYGGLNTFDDSDPNAKLKSIVKRDYWRVTVKNNLDHLQVDYVSNPMISYTSGIKQVILASTIHRDNKVVGLLGGSISWDRITQLLDEVTKPASDKNTKVMLVSKDGNYWYHWDKKKVLQVMKDSKGNPLKNEIGEKSVQLFNILAEESEPLKSLGRNMVAGKQGSEALKMNGENYQVFFMPIESTNYSIAYVVSSEHYQSPWYQLHIYLLVAFIAGMLAYIFYVYLVPKNSAK